MSETMYDYIKETPKACKKIMENRKNITAKFVKYIANNDIKRLILIASGSSYNASESSKYFIEKYLKIPVKLVTPLIFTNYETLYDKNDLIVAVSESGKSTATIDAVKKVISENMTCMVLTNDLESQITKETKDVIDMSCGIETVGYVTKGYTTTALDLMLMGLEGALALNRVSREDYENVINQINACIKLMPAVIESSKSMYVNNKDDLKKIKRLMVIGYGPNCGTALEGALKLQETIGIASTPYELEDFMHGPNLELTNEHTVFFINTKGKVEKHLTDLKEYVEKITDKSYMITHGSQSTGTKEISINHNIDEEISPLFMAIPFQMIAYLLAGDLNIDLSDEDRPVDKIFDLSKVE